MRLLTYQRVAILVMVCCFHSAASSQTQVSPTASKAADIKPAERIEENYDRFADVTKIVLQLQLSGTDGLQFEAEFGYKGKTFVPPKHIFTSFTAITPLPKGPKYRLAETLFLLVDGERLTFDVSRTSEIAGNVWIEAMAFIVPRDTLSRIANAKKVEGRLFATEFEITSRQLGLLRELINRAEPKEQKEP